MIVDKILPLASSVIKNNQGKILLLQRSDIGSYPDCWQLVEGKLEPGELPAHALAREVQEEIGAVVTHSEFQTVCYSPIVAGDDHYLVFRIVFSVKLDTDEIKLSDEHKAYGWYTESEALSLTLLSGVREVIVQLRLAA